MTKREKIYLIAVLVLLVGLVFKSFYFDEYKPVTEDETIFKEYVEKVASEQYDSFLYKNNLASFRVVSIKKLEDDGVSIIENDNDYETLEIKGKYKAKIRKYLFHFFPYGEDGMLSRK